MLPSSVHPPACVDTSACPAQVQHVIFGHVKLHDIPMGPLLISCVNNTTQLGAITKFVRLRSIPSTLSLMKLLNNTGPHMDPGGI